jgi:hypothetical protein
MLKKKIMPSFWGESENLGGNRQVAVQSQHLETKLLSSHHRHSIAPLVYSGQPSPWPPLISSSQVSEPLSLLYCSWKLFGAEPIQSRTAKFHLAESTSVVAGLAIMIMGVSGCGKS